MAKKLSEVLESVKPAEKKERVTTEQASVLAKLAMSGAYANDRARKVLTYYFEGLLDLNSIDDEDARAAIAILGQASTSNHRELCNKVLDKYISQFDAFIAKEQVAA